jgi:hypothetical protein
MKRQKKKEKGARKRKAVADVRQLDPDGAPLASRGA